MHTNFVIIECNMVEPYIKHKSLELITMPIRIGFLSFSARLIHDVECMLAFKRVLMITKNLHQELMFVFACISHQSVRVLCVRACRLTSRWVVSSYNFFGTRYIISFGLSYDPFKIPVKLRYRIRFLHEMYLLLYIILYSIGRKFEHNTTISRKFIFFEICPNAR